MTRRQMERVHEAIRSARLEFEVLAKEDVHVPTGELLEQLEEAEKIIEGTLNAKIQ